MRPVFVSYVHAYKATTHGSIASFALQSIPIWKGSEIAEFQNNIYQGAVSEDCGISLSPEEMEQCVKYTAAQFICSSRYMQHFLSPDNRGMNGQRFTTLTKWQACRSASEWISNDDVIDFDGSTISAGQGWSWSSAVCSYDDTRKAKEKSYTYLGGSSHLVSDMCQPDHVMLQPHQSSLFEKWADDNLSKYLPLHNTAKIDIIDDDWIYNGNVSDYLFMLSNYTRIYASFYGGILQRLPPYADKNTELALAFDIKRSNSLGFNKMRLYNKIYNAKQVATWSGNVDKDNGLSDSLATSSGLDSPIFYPLDQMLLDATEAPSD